MEQKILREVKNEEYKEDDEAQAAINAWKYVFGFTEMAVVKCALELGIAEALDKNGGSMGMSDLSSTLRCPQAYLYRLMRFLTHRKIFKQTRTDQGTLCYTQTPLSRRLMTMAAFIFLESSPVMLSPWLALSHRVRDEKCENFSPFQAIHGDNVWGYAANHPSHNKLINEAMACDARVVVPQIVKECPYLFEGVGTVVDVGGGDGTTLSMLVEAYPWIRGTNFDLPHVVLDASVSTFDSERIKHVGGDMFENIPKADVTFLMWVLHDWGDEECVEILKKCKEAITKDDDSGKKKVIIVEAVVGDEIGEEDGQNLEDVRLMLDMVMMAHTTNGKERTLKEWSHLLIKAGFSRLHVSPIQAVQSVIEAYP